MKLLNLLMASSLLSVGISLAYAMIDSGGRIEINNINEGWIESIWFLIMGIFAFHNYFKEGYASNN